MSPDERKPPAWRWTRTNMHDHLPRQDNRDCSRHNDRSSPLCCFENILDWGQEAAEDRGMKLFPTLPSEFVASCTESHVESVAYGFTLIFDSPAEYIVD